MFLNNRLLLCYIGRHDVKIDYILYKINSSTILHKFLTVNEKCQKRGKRFVSF